VGSTDQGVLQLDGIRVDLGSGAVTGDGVPSVQLSARELAVLEALAARQGQAVERAELEALTGCRGRAIDHAVRRLRAKVEVDPRAPRWVQTLHGVGYRLRADPGAAAASVQAPRRPALVLGDRVVDLDACEVRGAERTSLTTREVQVLEVLAEARGQVVRTEALERAVWGPRVRGRHAARVVQRIRVKIEEDPSEPRWLRTVPGVGYLLDPGARGALREPDAPLIGREAQVRAVTQRLQQERLVTLTGPAGVGKSRLALRVAREHAGPAHLVPLANARTLVDVEAAVADVLGVQGSLSAALAGRARPLLVLDHADAVVEVLDERLEPWLDAASDLRILLTSRRRLSATRGVVIEVPPLSPTAAAELLRQRLGPGADPALVRGLVARLDGLPLVLELAAVRASPLPPRDVLELLDEGLALADLRGSLGRVLDSSWQALDVRQRQVLVDLAWAPGPVDRDVACVLTGLPPAQVARALGELAARSLVRVLPDTDQAYDLFEAVREDARGRGPSQAAERLADWLVRQVPGWVRDARRGLDAPLRGRRELLREGARRAHGADAVVLLEGLAESSGDAREPLLWTRVQTLLEQLDDPAWRARARCVAAWALYSQGELDAAEEHARAGLREGEGALEPWVERRLVRCAGLVAYRKGAPARELLERAVTLAASASPSVRANTLTSLGVQAQREGRLDDALSTQRRALALARSGLDPRVCGRVLTNLGFLHTRRGEPGPAADALREAVEIHQRTGQVRILGASLGNLGVARLQLGDAEGALHALSRAIPLHRAQGHRFELANFLEVQAFAELQLGLAQAACSSIAEARSLFVFLGQTRRLPTLHALDGQAEELRGRPAVAMESYALAREASEALGQTEPDFSILEAAAGAAAGQVARAQQALERARSQGASPRSLKLAHAHLALGRGDRASAQARLKQDAEVDQGADVVVARWLRERLQDRLAP